jgi:hypothetical protein
MAADEDHGRKRESLADGPGVSIPRLLWLLIEGGWIDLARAVARYHGVPMPGTGRASGVSERDETPGLLGGPLDAQ